MTVWGGGGDTGVQPKQEILLDTCRGIDILLASQTGAGGGGRTAAPLYAGSATVSDK